MREKGNHSLQKQQREKPDTKIWFPKHFEANFVNPTKQKSTSNGYIVPDKR
jgi:hypothetical protein